MKTCCIAFFLSILICAAGSCTLGEKNKINSASKAKIHNGIQLQEDGLQVEEAFLANGARMQIDDGNKVKVGDRISVMLVVNGWKEKDGKVFLDASEKVATGSGETLTENPSMLAPIYTTGATPADAKYILLNQKIGRLNNPKDYVIITFKVWDKTSNKSVSGLYRLYLQ